MQRYMSLFCVILAFFMVFVSVLRHEYAATPAWIMALGGWLVGLEPMLRRPPPVTVTLGSPPPPAPIPGETWRHIYRGEDDNPFDLPEVTILRTLNGWVEFERKNPFPGLPSNRDQWPVRRFAGIYERVGPHPNEGPTSSPASSPPSTGRS